MNEHILEGKRILLLYARFFGYDVLVKEKLEALGAHVDLFDARANINSFEKAIRKINAKYYFKKQRRFHENIRKMNADVKYDFIFSNDVLDVEILKQYRNTYSSATMVLYMDDSVKNMREVENTFKYYDRVLTFDKKDSETYHILFRPLFYVDLFNKPKNCACEEKYDISFVGTCHSDRLSIIKKIQNCCANYRYYFFCYMQSWFMYYYHYLLEKEYRNVKKDFFRFKSISMKDVAKIMQMSKCVLDIQHPNQTGLTMRTIETIGAKRKLITTNPDVRNYDFYNEKNILIIDRNNPIISDSFLEGVFQPLEKELYEKYSLSGWIKDVFVKE